MDTDTLVSIIVPTFNESRDIARTLDCLLRLRYPHKEIIVVDDSNDDTPLIVRQFRDKGVILLKRDQNTGGRCGARNHGIRHSRGQVLVVLNADVLLPEDFIDKIMPHYEAGADYVLVKSVLANTGHLFPRYLEAQAELAYHGQSWIEWTEGFSCRRQVAFAVGLFPVTPIPLISGEDGYFGERLKAGGYKKVIDESIVITHIAPHTFADYWRIRKGRRSNLPLYFLYQRPFSGLLLKEILFTAYVAVCILCVVPVAWTAFTLCRHSPRRLKDLFPFSYAIAVERVANTAGGWASIRLLAAYIGRKDR